MREMYVQVFYRSLGWFDSTEPSQWEQGVQGTDTLVPGGSTAVHFCEPSRTTSIRASTVWRGYHRTYYIAMAKRYEACACVY